MKTEKRMPAPKFTSMADFVLETNAPTTIGSGSFANVILAKSKIDNKKYAIKTVC